MPSKSSAAKLRAAVTSSKRTPEDGHRRIRRYRLSRSCLNCRTSKRMCDRRSPCGRCTSLGQTELCAYEVDNPSQRITNVHKEAARLQKIVAELDGIIRQRKNTSHPRCALPEGACTVGANPGTGTTYSTGACAEISTSQTVQSIADLSPLNPASRSRTFPLLSPSPMPGASSGPSSLPSPFGTPLPLATPGSQLPSPIDSYASGGAHLINSMLNSDYDLSSLLPCCQPESNRTGADTHLNNMLETPFTPTHAWPAGDSQDHCGCLTNYTSYTTVLGLSLRLRRATEVLARSANHGALSDCEIYRRISELHRFTTIALSNIASPPEPPSHSSHPPASPVFGSAIYGIPGHLGLQASHSGPAQPQARHALQSPCAWDIKQAQPQSYLSPPWDDSLMSWKPPTQAPEWAQGL
ncbi:hypothetical protein FKP32DRAFT_1560031 [Trametes sanguinea]|nr:hypothetical protein FKP32DRAFT_1560031 [Trametes sanguinea]